MGPFSDLREAEAVGLLSAMEAVPSPIPMSVTHLLPGSASHGFRCRHDLLPVGPDTSGRCHHQPPRRHRRATNSAPGSGHPMTRARR